MATRKTSPDQVSMVHIGHTRLLLPVDQGLAVMKLLQNAVECEANYSSGWPQKYIAGEQPRLNFELLKTSQIELAQPQVAPVSRTRKNLLLEE